MDPRGMGCGHRGAEQSPAPRSGVKPADPVCLTSWTLVRSASEADAGGSEPQERAPLIFGGTTSLLSGGIVRRGTHHRREHGGGRLRCACTRLACS